MDLYTCFSVPAYIKPVFNIPVAVGCKAAPPSGFSKSSVFADDSTKPTVFKLSELDGFDSGAHLD